MCEQKILGCPGITPTFIFPYGTGIVVVYLDFFALEKTSFHNYDNPPSARPAPPGNGGAL